MSEAETMDVLMLVVKKILKEEVRDLFIYCIRFYVSKPKLKSQRRIAAKTEYNQIIQMPLK